MIVRSMSKISIAKILVAWVAICGLLWFLEINQIYQAALEIDPFLIGCVFALTLVGLAIQTEKWHLLLMYCAPGIQRPEALYSLLVGFGLGMFTPGRVGELGRGVVLRGETSKIALFAAVDRIASMAVTLLVGSGAIVWMWKESGWLALGGILCVLVFFASIIIIGARISSQTDKLIKIHRGLKHMPPRAWLYLCLWSILFNIVFLGQFYLLVGGIYGWSRQVAVAIPALFALKSVLPLSFLDIGVREGAAVWIYSKLGYDPLPAFNASLLVFVFNVAFPSGFGWLLWSRRDVKNSLVPNGERS